MKSPILRVPGPPALNSLTKFSLQGHASELEERLSKQKQILSTTCLSGESTVWYAKYNTGKTLIMHSLVIDACRRKVIEGQKVIIINADDSAHGLVEKLRLHEPHGVHILASGHLEFNINMLLSSMRNMINEGTASGHFVIVDTLKRAVDVMDKKRVREFTGLVRDFTLVGGSFLALAHTNKNPGSDGKPVPEGTGDVLNDFDAGYLIDCVGEIKETGERLIEFDCRKSRGQVGQRVHFKYDPNPELSYFERLMTVAEVDPDDQKFGAVRFQDQHEDDVIEAIAMSIRHSTGAKMDIVRSTAEAMRVSQKTAATILERHTGSDPSIHRWDYKRIGHGRMQYFLHPSPDAANSD